MKPQIKLYTLSTCVHCRNTKKFLNECKADYTFTDVDLLEGKERENALLEIKKLTPEIGFPTIVIDNNVIVGFDKEKIQKLLRI